jgi:hypothetical protein
MAHNARPSPYFYFQNQTILPLYLEASGSPSHSVISTLACYTSPSNAISAIRVRPLSILARAVLSYWRCRVERGALRECRPAEFEE